MAAEKGIQRATGRNMAVWAPKRGERFDSIVQAHTAISWYLQRNGKNLYVVKRTPRYLKVICNPCRHAGDSCKADLGSCAFIFQIKRLKSRKGPGFPWNYWFECVLYEPHNCAATKRVVKSGSRRSAVAGSMAAGALHVAAGAAVGGSGISEQHFPPLPALTRARRSALARVAASPMGSRSTATASAVLPSPLPTPSAARAASATPPPPPRRSASAGAEFTPPLPPPQVVSDDDCDEDEDGWWRSPSVDATLSPSVHECSTIGTSRAGGSGGVAAAPAAAAPGTLTTSPIKRSRAELGAERAPSASAAVCTHERAVSAAARARATDADAVAEDVHGEPAAGNAALRQEARRASAHDADVPARNTDVTFDAVDDDATLTANDTHDTNVMLAGVVSQETQDEELARAREDAYWREDADARLDDAVAGASGDEDAARADAAAVASMAGRDTFRARQYGDDAR